MGGPTKAEQKLAMLQRDLAAERQRIRGHPDLSARYVAALHDAEAWRELDEIGSLAKGVWNDVKPLLGGVSGLKRDPDRLEMTDLDSDDFTAHCIAEDDESGLVVVSDGVYSLTILLSEITSYLLLGRRSVSMTLSLLRSTMAQTIATGPTQQQLNCELLLRHALFHQTCLGSRHKLHPELRGHSRVFAESVSLFAIAYIVAHESAHFVLGHEISPTPTIDLEIAADAFAFDIVRKMIAVTGAPVAGSSAVTSAGIALLAIYLYENTVFVRSPQTHPDAEDRWARIIALGQAAEPGASEPFELDAAIGVVESAVNPTGSYTEGQWAAIDGLGNRHWKRKARQHMRDMPYFDKLLNSPLHTLTLTDLGRKFPDIKTVDTLTNRRGADVANVLDSIGVHSKATSEICDLSRSLTFRQLVHSIKESTILRRLNNHTLAWTVAIIAARRLEQHLQGQQSRQPED